MNKDDLLVYNALVTAAAQLTAVAGNLTIKIQEQEFVPLSVGSAERIAELLNHTAEYIATLREKP